MSEIKLSLLKKYLEKNSTQRIIYNLKNRPLIHFSRSAEKIMDEGFIYGAELPKIDFTFEDISIKHIERIKKQKGFNFAFDSLSYSFENNCYDYEYGIEGGMGMYEETAILFLSNAIYTEHPEGFNQCIFYGENADLENAILLKNEGEAEEYDENGNEYDCWSAKLKNGKYLISKEDSLNLQECIASSIKIMIEKKLYPRDHVNDFNSLYGEMVGEILNENKKLSRMDALGIAHNVRNEIIDEYNLNGSLVDYCDLCAEKVIEKLSSLGFEGVVINGFYRHCYEHSEIDNYGHFWVECDEFIIDPSRDQFDNTDYVVKINNETNKTYLYENTNISINNDSIPKRKKKKITP